MDRYLSKRNGFVAIIRQCFHSSSPLTFASYFHSSTSTLSKLNSILKEIEQLHSLKLIDNEEEVAGREQKQNSSRTSVSSIEISHPWPEWVNLMEVLLRRGYLLGDGREVDSKDSNRIRTACLNFARDRFDLIRYFSRKDIQLVAAAGCPSLDRKVVNHSKRLRAHVGIQEGNVCSFCDLRGSCERAYVKAPEDEVARTVDVMRILLTYGMDHWANTVENKQCLNKTVKESVRRLINQMVELIGKELNSSSSIKNSSEVQSSEGRCQTKVPMKQGDWICPKCNFLNFAKNIKCLQCDGLFQERLEKLREGQDHLPMKKGDWLCEKCNFLNFARNTKCLQCKEKPSNRKLNPGEWECPSCNYVNFKRNNMCLKCAWKRPKALTSVNFDSCQQMDQDCHQSSRLCITRNANWEGQLQVASDFWNDRNNDHLDDGSSLQKLSHFDDFPILGGKSTISQNPHEREKWKEDMSKLRECIPKVEGRKGYKDLDCANAGILSMFVEESDNEMAGWFGPGKEQQNK